MITPSGDSPNIIVPPGWAPPGGGYAPHGSSMPPPPSTGGKSGGCVGCSGKSSTNFSNSNSLQNSMHNIVQSWYDTPLQQPVDPRILIANTSLDSTAGTFARSSGFLASTWGVSPLVLSGSAVCTTLHTDDLLSVAEAAQWTFAHQGLNLSVTNPPCLQKVAFLRGGTSYEMSFGIDFGPTGDPNACCVETKEKCLGGCQTCEGCMWVCKTSYNGKRDWKLLNLNSAGKNLPCCKIPPVPNRICNSFGSGVSFV